MHRCFVAIGGNVGDVPAAFRTARERLHQPGVGRVGARSRMFRTAPVGPQAGPAYLNAVLELHTALAPHDLLQLLHDIEQASGRRRQGDWRPRPLDLDLLAYGEEVIHSPALKVPHAAAWHRRFVLDPWSDVAPHFVHPVLQATINSLRERLEPRPLPVAILGDSPFLDSLRAAWQNRADVVLSEPPPAPDSRGNGPESGPVESSPPCAAASFVWGGRTADGRFIDLACRQQPREYAESVLAAMLDTPIPLVTPRA
jgi:2-amino-4-hydroxy-6-hydroxymethyldihydropteridine diphosphokinase